MRDEEGTNSLVRHAVRSDYGEVRVEAIYELRNRPLEDFVPTLLDNLVAPVQSAYRVINDPGGSVHYIHALYREGPFADWSYRKERSIHQPGSPMGMLTNLATNQSPSTQLIEDRRSSSRAVSSAGAGRSARTYEQEIVDAERQIAQSNQRTAALNERIVAVLTGVTDESFGNEPRRWWDWWQDYTDYYRDDERPVYGMVDSSSDYIVPPADSIGCECFAAGTPVWTKTGQRPIESLQIGDFVLSQNVNTGEIHYKPVLARTIRPAGPTVQVAVRGETFQSTRGHPLWVTGVGWRMAKELERGATLHSLADSGRIESVESATNTETYNLVVADFNTYFIGMSGVLAHDNTPRRPTQAIVPGGPRK
jgi:hypothetical protein